MGEVVQRRSLGSPWRRLAAADKKRFQYECCGQTGRSAEKQLLRPR